MPSNRAGIPKFACSIISGNPATFFENIKMLESSGIDSFHFDMMDGDFVPRYGLFPEMLRAIREVSSLPIDVHLMLRKPELVTDTLIGLGASSITSHIEPLEHVHRFLSNLQARGCAVGLALNPGTPIYSIEPILENLNSITIMAINPGIVGHKFIHSTYSRIESIRKLVENCGKRIEIIVDGGVVLDNAKDIYEAGADTIVCGAGTVFAPGNSVTTNMGKLIGVFYS
jgi:ribulose-phosphate 3-epimerase